MADVKEKLVELLETTVPREKVAAYGEVTVTVGQVADHLIANGVTVQEWISVKDRLPEVNETVIVGDYTDGFVCAVKYLGDGLWRSPDSCLCTEAFTHWMPLPQPPKGE